MGHRVLILGGGFGGVAAASRLRRLLARDDEIVLVDRRSHFMMGFRKSMAIVGREPMEAGRRPLEALRARGIDVRRASITRIDPAARAAEMDGERIDADALVVALGAEVVPEAVPGLAEHGHHVYSPDGVPGARDALASIQRGRVVIGIFGAPYKCPPAPYELALLAQEATQARGARVEFAVFTPQPMSLPILGQSACEAIEGRLAGRMIEFLPNAKAERVEAGRVVLAGGGEAPFDLLLAVPPHRVPAVVAGAGLAEPGGWVRVDPRTLETAFDGVYAVGDVTAIPMTSGQPMPKAGVFAEGEGEVVAERIAARLAGREPEATFAGEGHCFLEVGGGEAMVVRGTFLAEPPRVELSPPSREILAEKGRFERERLDAWFGPA